MNHTTTTEKGKENNKEMCFMYSIEVRNRKIEQFLYLHGVDFVDTGKDIDGTTFWRYEDNEENRRIIDEYLRAQEIRARQREQWYRVK